MSIEAMKQALEALEFANVNHWWGSSNIEKAITNLRLAIIEEVERQEPGLEPSDMPDGENPMYDHPFFIEGMVWANNKLLEKNAAQRQRQAAVAAEREACAKLCDEMERRAEGTECCKWPTPADCAYAIRARGQA